MTSGGAARPPLRVVKQRWSGEPSVSFPVTLDGQDNWGTWVVAAAGTEHIAEDGTVLHIQPTVIVGLIPRQALWTAWFKPHGGKVDICSTARVDLDRSVIEFVDVELDVVWEWGTAAEVVDEDEYVALALPSDLSHNLRSAANEVKQAVDAGVEPFGRVGRDRTFRAEREAP